MKILLCFFLKVRVSSLYGSEKYGEYPGANSKFCTSTFFFNPVLIGMQTQIRSVQQVNNQARYITPKANIK
jgi:hypothetical protein